MFNNGSNLKFYSYDYHFTDLTVFIFACFQRLEDLLLECEGDLDQLIQKSEGMTAADPKMGMPIELTTLQAQYIELQAQVSENDSCQSVPVLRDRLESSTSLEKGN